MNIPKSQADRLISQHEAIGFIISGLNTVQLTRQPAMGKWSIHDNLAHLGLYQLLFAGRLKQILSGDVPGFAPYRAPEDPAFPAWLARPTPRIIQDLNAERKDLAKWILSLSPGELEKTGVHARYGPMAVPNWTEFFLLHEAHHLYTIFQLAHSGF